MESKPNTHREPWTLGLDIGIASVGWAVLAELRIIDLGVRAFDKAETADKGESLNLQRRTARLLRRRLWRRSWRLTKLARLLKRHGQIESLTFFKEQPGFTDSTWVLRRDGLDRLLSATEWSRVLYHLCKHRGFHWFSRAEERRAEDDAKGEGGKVKKGLAHTQALMKEKGYRTAAEMVLAEFPEAQRNKQGDYSKALSRVLLDDELRQLFAAQLALGNPHAGSELEVAMRGTPDRRGGLFWSQKPALAGKDLLKMLGHCTFEKGEYRAPKASFTAERHVWLTRLNNLRVIVDGVSRPLNEAERRFALPLPYSSGEKFTYKNLRNALVKEALLPESFRFGSLSYPSERQKADEKAKNPEDQPLVKLPAWHELRLTFQRAQLADAWQQIATPALEGRPGLLDQIGWVLSVYKDDAEVAAELAKLDLPGGDKVLDTLLGVRFDKFHALSLKALRRIVPLMETGLRYDEAVKAIPEYGHHSQRFVTGAGGQRYLPPFYDGRDATGRMKFREDLDVPRNPVVLRALNQARKVVNALIRVYGPPSAVHIEMARDLSRPLDERREVQKLQDEFKERNQRLRDDFEGLFKRKPNGKDFEKWLLYKEQGGQCAYSHQPLAPSGDCNEIFVEGRTQVDHALPYSRSYDDSRNNKVLVLTRENQNKGNRTAYEYLTSFPGGELGDRWRNFVAWVEGNKAYRQAKRSRLLRKNYGADESQSFKDRNLNDTRYICKFFKNYVEQHLQLAGDSDARRCVVVNGQLTAFLGARWGLPKNRQESDRHHARDAAIVAACSHEMVRALANYSKTRELQYLREGFPDPDTGEILNPAAHQKLAERFPEPWPHFRHELEMRLKTDDLDELRAEVARLGTYSDDELKALRPLFVSRAPQRRNGGAAHKETVYAKPHPDHRLMVDEKSKEGKTLSRRATPKELEGMALELLGVFDTTGQGAKKKYRLTEDRLKDIVAAERNTWMIHALSLWLGRRGDDPKNPGTSAFPRKPKKGDPLDGPFTGPEIKSVKANAGAMSGFEVRGGIAQNDSMLRVDVFAKGSKFHLVPVYVHHRVKGLPNRAIVAYKDETEWTDVADTDFIFSLYPKDLVQITLKKETFFGYFAGCDRSTGAVSLWAHDRSQRIGKDGLIRGIGVKTAMSVQKLSVDVLGHIFPAPHEVRRGLA